MDVLKWVITFVLLVLLAVFIGERYDLLPRPALRPGDPAPFLGPGWTFNGKPPGAARHPWCEDHAPGTLFIGPDSKTHVCD